MYDHTGMHNAYRSLLFELWEVSQPTADVWGGLDTLSLIGGRTLSVDLSGGRLPVPGNRRYWPHLAAAETAWQLMGTQDSSFIERHAPNLWRPMVDADGRLATTSHGYRWRHHFGRDQLATSIEALECNSSDDRVYISTWDPVADGLGGPDQAAYVPSITGFGLSMVGDQLHMAVSVRSCDALARLPYDVMVYALTLDAIAATLNVVPGMLTMMLSQVYCYDKQKDVLYDCVGSQGAHTKWATFVEPTLPCLTIREIINDPESYVANLGRRSKREKYSTYEPQIEILS